MRSCITRARAAALSFALGLGLSLGLAVAPQPAAAQFGPPGYYTAPTGARVFAEPQSGAEVLAVLPRGATGIEASFVEATPQHGFLRIIFGERDAWLFANSLEAISPETVPGTALPVGLQCSGAEPLWGAALDRDGAALSRPADIDGVRRVRLISVLTASGRLGAPASLGFSDGTTLLVAPAACSDGMSDRTHAWIALAVIQDAGDPVLYEGCCRLPPSE